VRTASPSGASRSDPQSAAAASSARGGQRDRCFRKALLDELQGHPWRFRSTAALRIVRWLFEEKQPPIKRDFCCDACNPDRVQAIITVSLGLGAQ
jgi:hypothetical protein